MSEPKLLITSSVVILLAFVAAGGWVGYGQKNNLANIQKGSIAKVDTSNWPTHQIEKLGLSVRMPPVYKQSSLAKEYGVDALFSTFTDAEINQYEKENADPKGFQQEGEVREPPTLRVKKLLNSSHDIGHPMPDWNSPNWATQTKFDADKRINFQIKHLVVVNRPAIIVVDRSMDYSFYFGYIKLDSEILEISYFPEDNSIPIEDFEAVVNNIMFD